MDPNGDASMMPDTASMDTVSDGENDDLSPSISANAAAFSRLLQALPSTTKFSDAHIAQAIVAWAEAEEPDGPAAVAEALPQRGLSGEVTPAPGSPPCPSLPKTIRMQNILAMTSPTEGYSLLHAAAIADRPRLIEALLQSGADPQFRSKNGSTALHVAARFGRIECMDVLIAADPSLVNSATLQGKTPIYGAVKHVQTKAVVRLLEAGAHVYPHEANPELPATKSLLCLAAVHKSSATCRYLVERGGMDINRVCQQLHAPPLLAACEGGSIDVVQYLLSFSNIDVNVKTQNRETPLYLACKNGHEQLVELILSDDRFDFETAKKNGSTPLYSACRHGFLGVVKLLVQKGKANLDKKRDGGVTPFHVACWAGHLEVAKYLVQLNPSLLNVKKDDNGTALHSACEKGKFEVSRWLVQDCGHPIDVANSNGETPLYLACRNGHLELAKWLIEEHGQDVNMQRKDHTSLLVAAARQSQVAVVEYLISKGADVHAERENGSTAMHVACSQRRLDLVVCLLEGGARIDVPTERVPYTPLEVAVHYNGIDIVRYTLRRFRNVLDNLGLRLLFAAAEDQNVRMFSLIATYDALSGGIASSLFSSQAPLWRAVNWPAFNQLPPVGRAAIVGLDSDVRWLLHQGLDDPVGNPNLDELVAQRTSLVADNSAALALLDEARKPWSKHRNSLYGPQFRTLVWRLLLVSRVAEARAAHAADHDAAADEHPRMRGDDSLPMLPHWMWWNVLSCLRRSSVQEEPWRASPPSIDVEGQEQVRVNRAHHDRRRAARDQLHRLRARRAQHHLQQPADQLQQRQGPDAAVRQAAALLHAHRQAMAGRGDANGMPRMPRLERQQVPPAGVVAADVDADEVEDAEMLDIDDANEQDRE